MTLLRRPWRIRLTLSALLTLAALLDLAVIILLLAYDSGLLIRFGPVNLRIRDMFRVLVVGVVIHAALLVSCWPIVFWRRLTMAMAASLLLCALLVTARHTPPVWSVADEAIIELYTMNATHGEQLLGGYSQFGWHHPGPLMFYALAPFYLAGGQGAGAIHAGAVATNIVSLIAIAWIFSRRVRSGSSLSEPVALAILLGIFLVRERGILASAWNPHIAVFPFLALLILSASVAAGDFVILPLAALFASFVAQAHIGLAPVSGAVVAGAVTGAALVARGDGEQRRWLLRWINISAWVLAAAWLLPISEEIAYSPGNMTQIWRFFTSSQIGQPLGIALPAFADTLVGVFRPGFRVATGWRFIASSNVLPLFVAIAEIPLLWLAARSGRRSRERFRCALASLCLLASSVALVSMTRIYGEIVDHEIFWVCGLGLVNAAVIAGFLAPVQRLPVRRDAWRARVMTMTCLLLVASGVGLGFIELRDVELRTQMGRDEAAAQHLTDRISTDMGRLGIATPIIRTDGDAWSVAAGVVLNLRKKGIRVSVSPDLVGLFDRQLLPNGEEDAEITICGSTVHQHLVDRSNNLFIGHYEAIFADAVKLPH